VTPIFFVRECVAFSAMGSLTSVCRGLKKFPKGWYEKSGRKKTMTRQAANSWHGFLVFCSGCGSQYAGKTLFFMFLTG
jgi:hypothetical protein